MSQVYIPGGSPSCCFQVMSDALNTSLPGCVYITEYLCPGLCVLLGVSLTETNKGIETNIIVIHRQTNTGGCGGGDMFMDGMISH